MLEPLILALIIASFAIIPALRIGKGKPGIILLLILAPVIDGLLAWWFFSWIGIEGMTLWGATIALALISGIAVQPMLSQRSLFLWKMASRQLSRRRRQATLLVASLIVASAVITSSLVIGDSLEASIAAEVELTTDQTDISVTGFDMRSGLLKEIEVDLSNDLHSKLGSEFDGFIHGRIATTAIRATSSDLGEPSAVWLALDAQQDIEGPWSDIGDDGLRWRDIADGTVVINRALADEVEVEVDDEIELRWQVTTSDGREDRTQKFRISKIVENVGQAAPAGSHGPAIFTSLPTAMQLHEVDETVNLIRISTKSRSAADDLVEDVQEILDESIGTEQAGFDLQLDPDTGSLIILNSEGNGRLLPELVKAWRENRSAIIGEEEVNEILAAPLKELYLDGVNLIALPDDRTEQIEFTEDGIWYRSAGQVTFQSNGIGRVQTWKVDGLAHDLHILTNGSALLAHDDGITGLHTDGKSWEEIEGQKILELSASARLSENNGLSLQIANESHEIPFTGSILSTAMFEDSQRILVEVEGIFERKLFEFDGSLTEIESGQIFASGGKIGILRDGNTSGISPGLENVSLLGETLTDDDGYLHLVNESWISQPIPTECGIRMMRATGLGFACDTTDGALVVEDNASMPRFPLLIDVGGIGEIPWLVAAIDSSAQPAETDVILNPSISAFTINHSRPLELVGLLPFAYGDDNRIPLSQNDSDTQNLGQLERGLAGITGFSVAEELASAAQDERSMLLISNGSVHQSEVESWLDSYLGHEEASLSVSASRLAALESVEEGAGAMALMFLVFGSFTMGAGLLLVVTVVIMLADERRSESGVVRALGLQRGDLRSMTMMEGLLTSLIGSVIGALLGLVLAWLTSSAFQHLFASLDESLADAGLFEFAWQFDSILAGIAWGFLIAMSTLWFTSLYTSRMKVIEALRRIPTARSRGVSWFALLLVIALLGSSAICGLWLIAIGLDSNYSLLLLNVAGAAFFSSILIGIFYVLPRILDRDEGLFSHLKRHAVRNTTASVGAVVLLWIALSDPWRSQMPTDELTFTVLGMVQVFAGVMVMVTIAPLILALIGKTGFFTKRLGPVIPTSLSYPLASPLRTGVMMGMFALTVFSVVVLAGYSTQFESYSDGFVEHAQGDFEVMVTGSRQQPIDLPDNPLEWNLNNTDSTTIDAVGKLSRAVAWVDAENQDRIPYILRGFDSGFAQHGGLPLYSWDESLGEDEDEVWKKVLEHPDLVLVDSSFTMVDASNNGGISMVQLSIGDSISLIDISNPGNVHEVQVAGVLEQSSFLFSPGIFLSIDEVDERFGGKVTRMYVSSTPDGNSETLASGLESDLAARGHDVILIEEEVEVLQGVIFVILDVFQAYLGIGIIVGIAGMGVVTYRQVSERSRQTGVMRAIGWKRWMVGLAYVIEVSWVALAGMLTGVLVGLGFHRALHEAMWSEQGVELVMPWSTIAWVILVSWALVIIATSLPVKKATTLSPASALKEV